VGVAGEAAVVAVVVARVVEPALVEVDLPIAAKSFPVAEVDFRIGAARLLNVARDRLIVTAAQNAPADPRIVHPDPRIAVVKLQFVAA
jgi:hypothetical protein